MAFQKAAGHNNLPNGVFSPTIYSKKVQMTFRKKAIAQDITNSDYFGEIKNFGDSVKIIKEPEVNVRPYARGTKLESQDLEDSDFTLTVDRSNYWQFKVDDIETSQSHVNWESMARDRAAYRLADAFDRDILGYVSGFETAVPGGATWVARTAPVGTKAQASADADELLAEHKLTRGAFTSAGTTTNSIAVGVGGTYDATPLALLNRMARLLDEQNVDQDGRWIIVDPVFVEILRDEDSKLINNDYAGSQNAGDQLRNGKILAGKIRGFDVYQSMNLPKIGNGPGVIANGGSNTNYGVIVAGHKGAIATAEQMTRTESFRSQETFGDIVRGMHVYGRKILRPESLLRAIYNASK